MTDTTTPDTEAPRRGGLLKKLLKGLVLLVILGGGGFAGGFFFADYAKPETNDILQLLETEDSMAGDSPRRVPKVMPEEPIFQTTYHEFEEPLTTNLRESRRFLQVGVGVSTQYDQTVVDNVITHKLAMRSDMLAVMSGFSEEQVAGKEGRDALALALKDAINARLEELEGFGGIEGVYFLSFVMQ